MRRIAFVSAPDNINRVSLDFSCYLASLSRSDLHGIFPEKSQTADHFSNDSNQVIHHAKADVTGTLTRQNVTDSFMQACSRRQVQATLSFKTGEPLGDILSETRFMDMLVMDATVSTKAEDNGFPSEFVKDILLDTECPVILSPQSFEDVDELVFAFDGGESSAFAIRQFAYLLPELCNKKIIILHVDKSSSWNHTGKYKLKQWLSSHFSEIEFTLLEGKVEDGLINFLRNRKNAFLIMGSYGRNTLSRFFRPSHSDIIAQVLCNPIFISHY